MPKKKKRKRVVTDLDRLFAWCGNCGKGLSDKDIRKGHKQCKKCRKAIAKKKLGRFS